jgi:hypothetical protein
MAHSTISNCKQIIFVLSYLLRYVPVSLLGKWVHMGHALAGAVKAMGCPTAVAQIVAAGLRLGDLLAT